MRAFWLSMTALVVITLLANVGLRLVPSSAAEVFIEKRNVRL